MLQKLNFKATLVIIVFFVTILSQLMPITYANAASITSGKEFYTNRPDICTTSTCDALLQWGVYPCVVAAANSNNFYGSGFNGGSAAYRAAKANINITDITSPAYTLLASLFAYYYGVDASSCGYTENTGLTNPSSIASLDNIGAAFDMLTILKGDNVSSTYFKYFSSSVTLYNVISPITDLVVSYNKNNQVCQQTKMTDTYNTAMDITSGSYDIGKASADTNQRTMVGLVQPQYSGKCGSVPPSGFYNKLDIICGNISSYPYSPLRITSCPNGSCSCLITATKYSPSVGQQVSVYINWHLSISNPTVTKVKNVVVQKTVNGNASGGNIAPQILQGPVGVNLGPPGYEWNQGNSNSYPTTLVDSPSLSTPGEIVYSASLTYVYSSNGTNVSKRVNCASSSITWGGCGGSSCNLPPPSAACSNSIQPTLSAKNTYDTAYTAWYNYDQTTFQPYKTKTAAAAAALAGPLTTYLADVAIYYSDVQIVNQIIQTYQNALAQAAATQASADAAAAVTLVYPAYNPPPPPTLQSIPPPPTLQSLPPPLKRNATKAQKTAYYNKVNRINATNRKTMNAYYAEVNTIKSANTTTSAQYQSTLSSYNNNYSKQISSVLNTYYAAIAAATLAYNNSVTSATNIYNTQLPIALANEASAKAAAIAAYNAMQPYYQAWVSLSEQTYNSTTLYYDNGPAPYYFYSNVSINKSYYNQDLNLYNTMEADLSLWKAALQKEDLVCDTKPYFTVTGGDIIAGPGFANYSCVSNNSASIYASNIGVAPWTGASDNLAALAPGAIYDLSTGTGGNQLTFANTTGTFPSAGYFGSTNGTCSQGYYGTNANVNGFSSLPTYQGLFNLDTVTSNNSCTQMDTTHYCRLGNPVDITGSPTPGSKIVLYVAGNAEIGSAGGTNISVYNDPNSLNAAADIPLLYVIASGNIYIDNTMSSIDGVYVASNTIFTCANNGQSFSSDTALIAGCANKLTVNGSLVANQIKLGRVYGGLSSQYGYPVGPAETFTYGPQVWLSHVRSSIPVNPDYQDLTELSPVV